MKFLSISPVMPYDGIGHAGGKTYNYYMKNLAQEPGVELSILCFSRKGDVGRCDLDDYGINHKIILSSGTLMSNAKHFLMDKLSGKARKCTMFSTYKHREILRYLESLERRGELPDVIQLEWTNFALSAPAIRKRFPKIKLIASEHDVSFLGAKRRYEHESGKQRENLEEQYRYLKKLELDALHCCDIVMPQNEKDAVLLVAEGIDRGKIRILTPYYHDMRSVVRSGTNHDILFWGAMYRPENYEAALWFIDRVMPLLADTDVRFVAAGNRPPETLKARSSERVIVTGFVEDETPYFERSLCFAAPLLTGAGIKVKVIEAISVGIPVLTNEIGIEGIPAEDGVSYYHCTKPEEYATRIRALLERNISAESMEVQQRQMIRKFFDLEQSAKDYAAMLRKLSSEEL